MKQKRRLLAVVLTLIVTAMCAPISAFAQQLPSKFDPVQSGKITPVRQSPQQFNLCWAYATIGSIEQSIIFSGLDNASVDLSESSLAWFSTQSEKQVLDDAERYSNNYIMAPAFSMSRLCGLENEADEPVYLHYPYLNPVSYSQQGRSGYELCSVEKVVGDHDVVKQKLMEFGGATVCYHSDLSRFSSDHKSYFQNERTDVNHSVTIVGWDDGYSRDNFGSVKPEKDGAWLVKSVWGTRSDNGYYWISYCEPELTEFYFYKVIKTESDAVYTHNGGMDRMYASAKDEVRAANVFTAQEDELLTGISFFVEENEGKGTDYTVNVYTNVKESTAVEGTQCAQIKGNVRYDGYYTVKMPSQIRLKKGERFSVEVSLRSDNGKNYFVVEDAGCKAEKGQSYYYSTSKGWQDCTDTTFKNAYINAYTKRDAAADRSQLKALVEKYSQKRGMQRAVMIAKNVLDDDSAGYGEISSAEKLLSAVANECDSYTVITDAKQWNEFASSVSSGAQYRDKTIVVEEDIDFSGVEFVCAGSSQENCFNGCFQGNGHVFSNITFNAKGSDPVGVFGCVGSCGVVNGLVVRGAVMTAETAGGIVGICSGGTVNACGFYGEINAKTCGGSVGRLENGTVSDCWSDVKNISGIIGESAESGRFCVQNCFCVAQDRLDSVTAVKSADMIEEMLNTNGKNNQSFRHFADLGGVVRPLVAADKTGTTQESIQNENSGITAAAAVCAVLFCLTVCTVVVILVFKHKKRS